MPSFREQIETDALSLPRADRAELAALLIASLDDDPDDEPGEVERAWDEEIRQRLAELDAGFAELVPADEVFAELRARPRGG